MESNILVKVYISCMETSIKKGLALEAPEDMYNIKEK